MAAPNTVLTYPLNGTLRDFTIPFEYLARKFVVVTLIGATRRVLFLNSDYRFTTKTTINTTAAWGPGQSFDSIEFRRVTSAKERLVDFSDGSILRAYDLNTSQVQSLHIAEEARDLTADTIGVNNNGDLDARGRRIVNLGDAVNPGEAVTLRQEQAWGQSALNQANAAAASAQAASASNQAAGTNNAQSYQNLLASNTARDQSAASASASQASNVQSAAQQVESTRQAGLSAASAAASEVSRQASIVQANKATSEADRSTTQADRAANEANKLANANDFMNSIGTVDTVTPRVTFKTNYQLSYKSALVDNLYGQTADAINVQAANFNVTKAMTVTGGAVFNGAAAFNGNLSCANQVAAANGRSFLQANVVGVRCTDAGNTGSTHLWMYNYDNSTRAIIYAATDGTIRFQAGPSLAATFAADGGSTFGNIQANAVTANAPVYARSGVEANGRITSYRNGIPQTNNMYSSCHFMAQTDDGTPPAYGFHRGGSYAFAMWMNGNQMALMDSGGTNREFVTNANIGTWAAASLSTGNIGSYAMLGNLSGANIGPGGQLASGLQYGSHNSSSGGGAGGTWRCHGQGNNGGITVWQRVA